METGGKYYEVYARNVGASASSRMTSIRLSGNDQEYYSLSLSRSLVN